MNDGAIFIRPPRGGLHDLFHAVLHREDEGVALSPIDLYPALIDPQPNVELDPWEQQLSPFVRPLHRGGRCEADVEARPMDALEFTIAEIDALGRVGVTGALPRQSFK